MTFFCGGQSIYFTRLFLIMLKQPWFFCNIQTTLIVVGQLYGFAVDSVYCMYHKIASFISHSLLKSSLNCNSLYYNASSLQRREVYIVFRGVLDSESDKTQKCGSRPPLALQLLRWRAILQRCNTSNAR